MYPWFWHYRQFNLCCFFSTFEVSSFCPFIFLFCLRSGMLKARNLNFYIYLHHEKQADRYFFFFFFFLFFRWNSPCGIIPLFRLRRWVPCVRSSSYSSIQISLKFCRLFMSWSVHVHVVLAYCQYNSCYFFSTFELNHFRALNTIKVHYRGYFVCATPPTVIYR